MKLDVTQIAYLEKLLVEAEVDFLDFSTDELLRSDIKAIRLAIKGEYTQHFKEFLAWEIEFAELNPGWRVNPDERIDMFTSILENLRLVNNGA